MLNYHIAGVILKTRYGSLPDAICRTVTGTGWPMQAKYKGFSLPEGLTISVLHSISICNEMVFCVNLQSRYEKKH